MQTSGIAVFDVQNTLDNRIYSDTIRNVNTLLKSEEFNDWLIELKDQVGRALIIKRIRSAEAGHFGDCEPVGEGVSELRIHYGPGRNPHLNPLP